MMLVVEPLKKVIIDNRVLRSEEVKDKKFGGFCTCGGLMHQKFWIQNGSKEILISECEKCWRNEALIFNSKRFVGREEVTVLNKADFIKYLRDMLTEVEFESLIKKASNSSYKPSALSRAKKKLGEMGLGIDEVLELLR